MTFHRDLSIVGKGSRLSTRRARILGRAQECRPFGWITPSPATPELYPSASGFIPAATLLEL
jgi:hypothetical protein